MPAALSHLLPSNAMPQLLSPGFVLDAIATAVLAPTIVLVLLPLLAWCVSILFGSRLAWLRCREDVGTAVCEDDGSVDKDKTGTLCDGFELALTAIFSMSITGLRWVTYAFIGVLMPASRATSW